MSAVPGWYPDPAGSRDLRLFDGAGWTSHLRPADAPEAFAPQPTDQPAPERILAAAGAVGAAGAASAATAEPSAYFGSAVPAPAPFPGQDWSQPPGLQPTAPGSRRRVIALGVFGAIFIAGGAFATIHLASTGSIYERTSIAMPKTAAGFKQVAQVSANASGVLKSLPFSGMRLGIYGQGDSPAPAVMLMAGRGKTAAANVDSMMSKVESGFSASANGEEATQVSSFQPLAAGPLGGRMSCATFQIDAMPAAACLFVDQGAAGALFTYNTSTVDTTLMHRLRAAVEKRS
jgi:hypothetical protein